MNELYPIGKVSSIMGVSVQTLRYYDKIGLLSPAYINPETGYRYYAQNQFHFIDRIKYLQSFGFRLSEIHEILKKDDISLLVSRLEARKQAFQEEIARLKGIIDSIEWYKNYFTYVDPSHWDTGYYTLHLEKRYITAAKCYPGEPSQAFHVRLNEIRSSNAFRELIHHRQFVYLLDYDGFMNGELHRQYLGMFLKEKPTFSSPHILEIPEGDYLCYKARILSDGWNPYFAKLFFEGKQKPAFVLANEFEDSLHEYSQCVYEIQIPISQTS